MEYSKDLMKDLTKYSKEMINNTQETYKKVSDAIGKIKKEFESVDFSSVLKSDLNAIESLAKGALSNFGILGESIESITGKSLNSKSATDKIKDSYVTVKDAVVALQGEALKFAGIDISKAVEGLSKVKNVATDVKKEMLNMVSIDFSKAVKGGASGIAEAAGTALTSVGSIGKSVFAAVTDVVNKMHENQLKEVEANYKQQNDTINKNLQERKKAIQAEADAEKEVYASQIEEYNKREEEKAAIEEEWQEYLKEYNAGISDEMTEEEYLKLEEEKAAEEEKYNNKMSMYENDAAEKQSIEEQMAIIDEERKLKEQEAETDAFLKKKKLTKSITEKNGNREKIAIANKASGIFNATISMLQGIAQAVVAGMGFGPLAIGMVPTLVGIATAKGVAQISAIASQPLPEVPSFSDGGWVGKANDKNFNFLPKAANPNDRTLAWLSEGEYVLPHNEALAYQKMIASSVNNYGDNNSVKNINVYTTVNAVSNASPDLIAKSNAEAVVLAISRGY